MYHRGKAIGAIREFSDTLLIFLLKGAKPSKYRDNWQGQSENEQTPEQILQEMADEHGLTDEPEPDEEKEPPN